MLPTHYERTARLSPGNIWVNGDEFLSARLAVIAALEASLQRSRKALLAMDLDGIERGTREQAALLQELKAAERRAMAQTAGDETQSGEREQEDDQAFLHQRTSKRIEELRRSENRLREASLLQAALLARARHKLRVLGNMLAGSSATYGGYRLRRGAFCRVSDGEI